MKRENKERVYNVMFVKQKGGSYSPRITVPYSILRDLGIKPGDKVQYSRCENGFVVRKYEGL